MNYLLIFVLPGEKYKSLSGLLPIYFLCCVFQEFFFDFVLIRYMRCTLQCNLLDHFMLVTVCGLVSCSYFLKCESFKHSVQWGVMWLIYLQHINSLSFLNLWIVRNTSMTSTEKRLSDALFYIASRNCGMYNAILSCKCLCLLEACLSICSYVYKSFQNMPLIN